MEVAKAFDSDGLFDVSVRAGRAGLETEDEFAVGL